MATANRLLTFKLLIGNRNFFIITKGRVILMILAAVLTFNDVLAAENRMMMNSDPVLLKEELGSKGKKWPLSKNGRKEVHTLYYEREH
jgi:hypothetical protein